MPTGVGGVSSHCGEAIDDQNKGGQPGFGFKTELTHLPSAAITPGELDGGYTPTKTANKFALKPLPRSE